MGNISELHKLKQSLWYDNIQRRLLENGELSELISRGDIRGVTSNPTIFHKAIANSNDYDEALKPMAWAGLDAETIFWKLATDDIRAGADLFLPLYEQTKCGDGYVSIEVSPYLAHDTENTVSEAKKLWKTIDRPNLMIKIPATIEGIPAITQVIAAGINVNVTLIFSFDRYEKVIDAYMNGLEERVKSGHSINTIASVASFFVSRLDVKVDKLLANLVENSNEDIETTRQLMGKAAIANTRLAYALFNQKFSQKRFKLLQEAGGNIQRPLWASTGTPNPNYSDVLYVEELIAPHTVNTVPPATLDAFRDHGSAKLTLEGKEDESKQAIDDLEKLGISYHQVTEELEKEGVKSFADSFTMLLDTIDERRKSAQKELGSLQKAVSERVKHLDRINAIPRLYDNDPTLWTDDPKGQEEIKKRLGWLESPIESQKLIPNLVNFTNEVFDAGYTHGVLLGMGGSSLSAEVYRETFGAEMINQDKALVMTVLDSTDPTQILEASNQIPLEKTLFIVASKSGTTSEVKALLDYFWDQYDQRAGEHFVAITDPGTSLEELARERNFRSVFLANPKVGGRYSALIPFGLVPAALLGVDIVQILIGAQNMHFQCSPDNTSQSNPGLVLGAILGEAALQGRDKVQFIIDSPLQTLGAWLEQLIAESSGKEGKGIIPLTGKPLSNGDDEIYIYIRLDGEKTAQAQNLRDSGAPVIELPMANKNKLGAEFFRWEIATAIACAVIGVNAFDQPNVQESKTRTAEKIKKYHQKGVLDEGMPIWENQEAKVYGIEFSAIKTARNIADVVSAFLEQSKPGEYIAINAFIPRNSTNADRLAKLQEQLQEKFGNAVMVGFGPRFLHSTGQLHKGGANKGLFLEITQDAEKDVDIPGHGMSFGTLEIAQALGDLEALQAQKRRSIRVHLIKASIEDLV